MKRPKTAWIPIAVLFLAAMLSLFFTLWMGAAEYNASTLAFSDRGIRLGGFAERLSEVVFLSDLFRSFILRFSALVLGCAAGFLLGLLFRRIPSPPWRALPVCILGVFAFLPPQVLLFLPPLSAIGLQSVRFLLATALPVLSLSLFAAFSYPGDKKTAALVPLAAGAFFVLSPDLNAALAFGSGGNTLDVWSAGLMKSGAYTASAQVSSIKILLECLIAIVPALLLGQASCEKRPPEERKGSFGKAAAALLPSLVCSLLLLLPAFLASSVSGSVFASSAFHHSLTSAAVAFVISLAVSGALLMTMPYGKGMFFCLAAALVSLSAFSSAKFALAEQASVGADVTVGFFAAFSPLSLSLMICGVMIAPEGILSRIRCAMACAALSAARGSFSVLGQELLGVPSLGGIAPTSWGDPGVFGVLVIPLTMFVLSAFLLSFLIAETNKEKAGKLSESIILAQGWSKNGSGAAAKALPDAPARPASASGAPAAPAPVIRTAVPAASAYAMQFTQAQTPHSIPESAVSAPEEDPPAPETGTGTETGTAPETAFAPAPEITRRPVGTQAADAADSSPYSRPSGLSVSGFPEPAEEREAEIPEDAPPSPAQVVSMINALARMRAIGIMDNAEYRDKYDKLMKLM